MVITHCEAEGEGVCMKQLELLVVVVQDIVNRGQRLAQGGDGVCEQGRQCELSMHSVSAVCDHIMASVL